jgi:hypothetical protein
MLVFYKCVQDKSKSGALVAVLKTKNWFDKSRCIRRIWLGGSRREEGKMEPGKEADCFFFATFPLSRFSSLHIAILHPPKSLRIF